MKTLLKSTAVLSAVLFTVSATAAQPTQNENLASCKSMIKAEFNEVKRIKLASLRDRRGNFTAKFRVSADGQRAKYTCTVLTDSDGPQLVRTDNVVNDTAVKQVASGE